MALEGLFALSVDESCSKITSKANICKVSLLHDDLNA